MICLVGWRRMFIFAVEKQKATISVSLRFRYTGINMGVDIVDIQHWVEDQMIRGRYYIRWIRLGSDDDFYPQMSNRFKTEYLYKICGKNNPQMSDRFETEYLYKICLTSADKQDIHSKQTLCGACRGMEYGGGAGAKRHLWGQGWGLWQGRQRDDLTITIT